MSRVSVSLVWIVLLGLALLVGCTDADEEYADRMAEEHAGETPNATPMTTGDARPINTETVVYGTVNGVELTGFMAVPEAADPAMPAVIVIQEWWGLNDNIRAMAEKLAQEGYRALAVDLYNGEVADTPEQAMQLMRAAAGDMDAATANLTTAYTYLTETHNAPKVGSIGWCFGGGMSLVLALALPQDLDAAVIYYGRVVQDRDRLATLELPILGIFGAEDQGIPVDGVRQFEATLQDLGKDAAIHIYEGADHAFANPSGQRYQAEAAEDAWAKTVAFFATHLE